jgi:transcription elongation GreA/GreB family factor
MKNHTPCLSLEDIHVLRSLLSVRAFEPVDHVAARTALAQLLEEAKPPHWDDSTGDFVGLHDEVTLISSFGDLDSFSFTVVLPPSSDPRAGKLSVFAPLAFGVLGRRVGEEVSIESPGGSASYRVSAVKKARALTA